MSWRGLYNQRQHRQHLGLLFCFTPGCSMFCLSDALCLCCSQAQAAAVAAVVAPHVEAVGWQCPCCSAVDGALRGQA